MLSRSPPGAPLRRSYVLVFALSALVFHVWLARRLGAVQAGLASTLGDDAEAPVSGGRGDDGRDLEGAEWRRLEGVRALLGIGKLWSWCSAAVAGAGIAGLLRDRLPLLRLFVLNGFLSLSLDLLLLALILLLLTFSSPSSSHGLATPLCGALSLSFGLPDLLGLSLEACEDRFEGVVVSALATFAVVEGIRAWAAVKVLGFYAARASPRGGRRRSASGRGGGAVEQEFYDSPVELDGPSSPGHGGGLSSSASGGGKKKRRDSHSGRRDRSNSTSSMSSRTRRDETRIFLLPRPEERGKRRSGDERLLHQHHHAEGSPPLLTLTASSPTRTSFPPSASSSSSSSLPHPPPSPGHDTRRVLVYTPVMLSVSEARSLGATELVLHGPGRTYPPTGPLAASATATASASATGTAAASRSPRSRSATITPGTASVSGSGSASTSSATLAFDSTAAGPSAGASPTPLRHDSDDLLTPVAETPTPTESHPGTSSGGGGGAFQGPSELAVEDGRAKRA
ncbi:hypothetical protein DMC30DRAFT_415826 [Rhodotorula diobovata]|uniref:Uncharacterized protein n=1 Tax=Rhodotorula diobovata TaxID=5288 RepID=A0A5C5FZZ8_9BASI|nr:hypothetical protein DMC30DRAFT_415826 [Rhodotorula diobovata]